jgi:AbrB family looped-hinge helix DNA binding protein
MPSRAKSAAVRAKVTSKGQVTIPVSIRRQLGLKPGDHLRFEPRKDGVHLVHDIDIDVFEKWRGIGTGFAGMGKGRKAILNYFRELRGHDDID